MSAMRTQEKREKQQSKQSQKFLQMLRQLYVFFEYFYTQNIDLFRVMKSTNDSNNELLNMISFSLYEKKYKQVIALANKFLSLNAEGEQGTLMTVYLNRGEAHCQQSNYKQCIEDCESALKLGAQLSQVYHLQMRAYLESNEVSEAEKLLSKMAESNTEYKKILQHQKAIEIMKDERSIYCLSKKQQNLLGELKSWVYSGGGYYDKIKLAKLGSDYRGAVAIKAIRKKQPIVYIPKSHIITLEMAKKNPISMSIIKCQAPLTSPKHTFISIFLLEESKNPQSPWKLYIDLLPEDHSSFPINYTKEELSELIGSPFLFMIHEKVLDLKKDYDLVIKCDKNFEKYSFKEFCWARMMVGSRIFGLNITGVKTEVLVPFADMLNHKLPKQTVWNYVDGMNGFIIESQEDVEVGEQVFDSYGRKCNSRFLLSYGFVLQNNKDNQITLKIGFNEEDELHALKRKMMKESPEISEFTKIMKVSLSLNNNKFYELMGFLRFIGVEDIETLQLLTKISNIELTDEPYRCIRTPPISIKNEITSWKKFQAICQKALSQYPQTIQEDRKILKNKKLSINLRNIVTLRMGQKYVLTEFICICEQVVAILQSQNFFEILSKQKDKIYYKYLFKILSLMPGVDKTPFSKIKELERPEQSPETEEQEDGQNQII